MIELFELHASAPPMRSPEYQATIPLKFLIIIHNYPGMRIFRKSTNQITTRFSGSSDVAGQRKQLADSDVAERRKQLEAIRENSDEIGLSNYAGKMCNHN